MLRKRTRFAYSVAFLSLTLFTSTAGAQTPAPAPGFALNRYNPAERGSEWFAVDSLDLRGHVRPAFGVTFDWAYKPLVIYAPNGDERTVLVENQVFVHAGASLVLSDRFRVGLSAPIALAQSGTTGSAEGYTVTAPTSASFGDLRLGIDVRLFGVHGDPLTVALGAQLFAPTGKRNQFTGDEALRLLPHLSAAGDFKMLTYAATLGVQYRGMDEGFAGKETGTEFIGAAAAGVRVLDGALVVGPEIHGSAVIASGVEAPKPSRAPVELLVGGHYTAGSIRVGAGAGPGLTRGLGEPTLRVLASVDYVSRADTDTDGDGIIDKVDACVTIPGVASPDPKKHGCPSDRDKDGILDRDDACVEVPGVAHSDPKKNGCPSDRDNDGILDGDDACPDILGVKSAIAALNGCPVDEDKSSLVPLDRDRDTVLDDADKCPDQPGLTQAPASVGAAQRAKWEEQFLGCPEDIDNDKIANLPDACPRHPGAANKDPQKHGCPMVVPDGCQIKLLERVFFKTQSEVLESAGAKGKTTQAVLQAMLELLRTSPQLTHIEVQGHASQDAYAKNQELSEKRAMSVVTWLTERGIDPSRLVPKGYGTSAPAKDVPVDRKNKELHQRVEFHIVGCDKTKAR